MKLIFNFLFFILIIIEPSFAEQGEFGLPGLSVNFGKGANLVDTLEVLVLFTIITLAPAVIILCTCFTRIIVVLSFMRQAIGTQNMPPNQLLIGFALFLTVFVMQPTGEKIYYQAVVPYMDKQIN